MCKLSTSKLFHENILIAWTAAKRSENIAGFSSFDLITGLDTDRETIGRKHSIGNIQNIKLIMLKWL